MWATSDRGTLLGDARALCHTGQLAVVATLLLAACAPSDDYFTKVGRAPETGADGGPTSKSSTTSAATGVGGLAAVSSNTSDTGGSNGSGGETESGGSGSGGTSTTSGSGGAATRGGTGGGEASGGTGGMDGPGGSGGVDGSGGTGGASGGSGGTGGSDCAPEAELCDGRDNDCNQMIDDDACEADCAGFVLDGQSYMYCGEAIPGGQIENRCAENGMVPVRIDSMQENAALVDAVQLLDAEFGEPNGQQRAFWIGASDAEDEGTWRWLADDTVFWMGAANGTPVDDAYVNWGAGRPNSANTGGEDCAALYLRSGADGEIGEWNDLDCSDGYSVVCELP